MKQDQTGSVIITGAEETLSDAAKGPNSAGPVCTDWREKAFELATQINGLEQTMTVDRQRIKYLEETESALLSKNEKLRHELNHMKFIAAWLGVGLFLAAWQAGWIW